MRFAHKTALGAEGENTAVGQSAMFFLNCDDDWDTDLVWEELPEHRGEEGSDGNNLVGISKMLNATQPNVFVLEDAALYKASVANKKPRLKYIADRQEAADKGMTMPELTAARIRDKAIWDGEHIAKQPMRDKREAFFDKFPVGFNLHNISR